MSINSRTWIAAAALVIASSAVAIADTKNEVRAVSFSEEGGITRVHVRGAQTPTFTVYKLERPTRIVVDLPQARLADALRGHESASVFTPGTWAVSTIAAQQLDDGATRVIVTLARPGRYDVKTQGNDVVVWVTPRDKAPEVASPMELEKARQQAEVAERARAAAERSSQVAAQTARQSQEEAEAAKAEAERLRTSAAEQAARAEAAQRQVEAARKGSAADLERATRLARAAETEAAKARAQAAVASTEAEQARKAAQLAQVEADRRSIAAEQARHEALAEAAVAKQEAARARAEMATASHEVARAKTEADAARRQAAAAGDAVARAKTEADAARRQAAAASDMVVQAKTEADTARRQAGDAVARAKIEADAAKREAEAAKVEAARARAEAQAARSDAAKQSSDARRQLAALERDIQVAKQLQDKTGAALVAAQGREAAARDTAVQARKEAELAEAAARRAKAARDQADAASRARLVEDARLAEERLGRARLATADAEARRRMAEKQAAGAKAELDASRSALVAIEQQRAAAVAATNDAARRRSEAEAAATEANQRRSAAEQQRALAEAAAREARASVVALNQQRAAAERAASELAQRTRAEAQASAEVVAASARKASDAEMAAARAELGRLSEQRKRAETELAERRASVAQHQAEANRLESAAAQARDAAAREESRRVQLAREREQEERDLARLKAQKVQAQVAATPPAPAPAPASPAALAKVSNVSFTGSDVAGTVEISLAGDASVALGEVGSSAVELIVDGAELAKKLERTLDVSKFGSPVRRVSTYRDRTVANRVHLVAELAAPALPTVVRDGNVVRWRLASSDVARVPARTTNIPPTVVGGFGAASTPLAKQTVTQLPGAGARRRTYYGAVVEFDFKDAPIHDLLRIIADTGGVNIVVPDSIDAKVTVRLKRVPWDQALEVILASHGLWYRREGNLYRIAPRKELDAEDEAEAARRAAAAAAEMPRPEVVTLNYASADELKAKLEGMLSPKGKIDVDGRTNSLIINDIAAARESIARLALQLDTQTPQITIEARIVEARSTFVRQFGIQWGGRALMSAAGGNATGLLFPSSLGLRGGASDGQTVATGVDALPSDFAINLPAAAGAGSGGAIGMSLGSIGGNFNINLRLSALEDTGTVRIITAPKITVINNKPATIKQGVSIPISVVSAAGTQTQFMQADLSLEVTPYVSQRDCAIAMNLNVTKNEPDFVNVGARGDPSILRKEARTTMLVQDGETSVLGGIYTRNTGLAYKKVPFFGDLPVIGWFFKNRRENDDRTEILVFITPKITNKASLRCVQ